jgi:hypothetical protein
MRRESHCAPSQTGAEMSIRRTIRKDACGLFCGPTPRTAAAGKSTGLTGLRAGLTFCSRRHAIPRHVYRAGAPCVEILERRTTWIHTHFVTDCVRLSYVHGREIEAPFSQCFASIILSMIFTLPNRVMILGYALCWSVFPVARSWSASKPPCGALWRPFLPNPRQRGSPWPGLTRRPRKHPMPLLRQP